jgi:hypothetical protein
MGYSGHVTLSLPVKRPQLGRIWRNFRLRMHRTYFRTLTNVTSGHVTGVTFGHVTSGHDTSGHAQWSYPPHDPPQMRLCPCPYTTYLIINTFLPRVRINYKYLFLYRVRVRVRSWSRGFIYRHSDPSSYRYKSSHHTTVNIKSKLKYTYICCNDTIHRQCNSIRNVGFIFLCYIVTGMFCAK